MDEIQENKFVPTGKTLRQTKAQEHFVARFEEWHGSQLSLIDLVRNIIYQDKHHLDFLDLNLLKPPLTLDETNEILVELSKILPQELENQLPLYSENLKKFSDKLNNKKKQLEIETFNKPLLLHYQGIINDLKNGLTKQFTTLIDQISVLLTHNPRTLESCLSSEVFAKFIKKTQNQNIISNNLNAIGMLQSLLQNIVTQNNKDPTKLSVALSLKNFENLINEIYFLYSLIAFWAEVKRYFDYRDKISSGLCITETALNKYFSQRNKIISGAENSDIKTRIFLYKDALQGFLNIPNIQQKLPSDLYSNFKQLNANLDIFYYTKYCEAISPKILNDNDQTIVTIPVTPKDEENPISLLKNIKKEILTFISNRNEINNLNKKEEKHDGIIDFDTNVIMKLNSNKISDVDFFLQFKEMCFKRLSHHFNLFHKISRDKDINTIYKRFNSTSFTVRTIIDKDKMFYLPNVQGLSNLLNTLQQANKPLKDKLEVLKIKKRTIGYSNGRYDY